MSKFIIKDIRYNKETNDHYYRILEQPFRNFVERYTTRGGTSIVMEDMPGIFIIGSNVAVIYLQGRQTYLDDRSIRVPTQIRLQFLEALQEYCDYKNWEFEASGYNWNIGRL